MAPHQHQDHQKPSRPRRFAPQNPEKPNPHHNPTLHGIIFDVDGTLCLPQNYMFAEMRAALGIPKSVDIITHMRSLSPDIDNNDDSSTGSSGSSPCSRASQAIEDIERRAMSRQKPQPGLRELISYLTGRGVRKALCTRNFPAPVDHLLKTYLPDEVFDPIITRDTEGIQPKPSPEGLLECLKVWVKGEFSTPPSHPNTDAPDTPEHIRRTDMIMVGDSIDDMTAAHRAGAAAVLLVNQGENDALADHEYVDLSITRLDDLIGILEDGFVGRER